MTDMIRVLVVDDHVVVRKGIHALLKKERGIRVIIDVVLSGCRFCASIEA